MPSATTVVAAWHDTPIIHKMRHGQDDALTCYRVACFKAVLDHDLPLPLSVRPGVHDLLSPLSSRRIRAVARGVDAGAL